MYRSQQFRPIFFGVAKKCDICQKSCQINLWIVTHKKNLRNMQSQGKSPCARHKIICNFFKDTNKKLFPCLEVRCEIQINQFWNFTIESLTILFRIKNDDFTKCYFMFQINLQIQDHWSTLAFQTFLTLDFLSFFWQEWRKVKLCFDHHNSHGDFLHH